MTGKSNRYLPLSALLAGTALVWAGAASGAVSLALLEMDGDGVVGPWESVYEAGQAVVGEPEGFMLVGMSGETAKSGDDGQAGKDDKGETQSGDDNSTVAGDTIGDQDRDRVRDRDGDCDGDQDGDCDPDRDRLRDRDCDGDPDKECDQDRDRDRDRDGRTDDADES